MTQKKDDQNGTQPYPIGEGLFYPSDVPCTRLLDLLKSAPVPLKGNMTGCECLDADEDERPGGDDYYCIEPCFIGVKRKSDDEALEEAEYEAVVLRYCNRVYFTPPDFDHEKPRYKPCEFWRGIGSSMAGKDLCAAEPDDSCKAEVYYQGQQEQLRPANATAVFNATDFPFPCYGCRFEELPCLSIIESAKEQL